MAKSIAIPNAVIINKIYLIRGHKVMLDSDLAELYGVETKELKRQVRRNPERKLAPQDGEAQDIPLVVGVVTDPLIVRYSRVFGF